MSICVLSMSMDGASTASLDRLLCLKTFIIKNFLKSVLMCSDRISCDLIFAYCLLSWALLRRVRLRYLYKLRRYCLWAFWACLQDEETQLSQHRKEAPVSVSFLWPCTKLAQVCPYLSCTEKLRNGHSVPDVNLLNVTFIKVFYINFFLSKYS